MELGEREIVIKDACILFDLVDLELLNDFFKLDLRAYTTPFVIHEITNETQEKEILKFINDGNLIVDFEGQIEIIYEFFEEHKGLSLTDCSILEIAVRKNAVILSSDGSLRKISIRKNLTVRGILWIIEELHRKKILSTATALEKLKNYKAINQRAPVIEIQNLINKLNK